MPGASDRKDADIARSAENALEWMTTQSAAPIKVMVENGWITLSGEVEWEYQRQIASGAVRYLMGVKGVSDQIVLKPCVSAVVVKADIEAALKRRALGDAQKITVNINGNNVTLSGTVHSWSERELASQSAWNSPGVKNVVDEITITA